MNTNYTWSKAINCLTEWFQFGNLIHYLYFIFTLCIMYYINIIWAYESLWKLKTPQQNCNKWWPTTMIGAKCLSNSGNALPLINALFTVAVKANLHNYCWDFFFNHINSIFFKIFCQSKSTESLDVFILLFWSRIKWVSSTALNYSWGRSIYA